MPLTPSVNMPAAPVPPDPNAMQPSGPASMPSAQPAVAPGIQDEDVQQVQVPGQPVNPDIAHSAAVGHGFKSILRALEGTSTEYQQTPQGPVPVQVKNGAQQFFKNVIASAIMGGMAGQGANTGFQGAVRGAGAAMQTRQQQDLLAQKQAQEQYENNIKARQQDREDQLLQAQVANMHSEQVSRQHNSDLLDKEYHDRHNAASAALYSGLKDAGGVAPVDGKLPENMTAYELSQAYAKDPSIRSAPEGYVRHFIDKTDSSEVSWNGTQWTHPDGTPADMTDKTSIQVVDVPKDAMKTKQPVSGADLNKIAGQDLFDPKKTYQVSPLDQVALNTKRMAEERSDALVDLDKKKATAELARIRLETARMAKEGQNADKQAFAATYKDLNESITTLRARLKDEGLMMSPEERQDVLNQINESQQELRGVRQKLFPETKLPEKQGGSASASPTDPIQATVNTLKGKSAQEVQAALNDPKNGVPEAAKAEIWKRLGIKPPSTVALNPLGQGVVNAAKSAAPVVGGILSAIR